MNYPKDTWRRGLVAGAILAAFPIVSSTQAASVVSAGAFENDYYIAVLFDEAVDETTALDVSNYTLSAGTAAFVTLRSDRIAELALTGAVSENFNVTVAGVETASGTPINGTVPGEISSMFPGDLGFPFTMGRGLYLGGDDFFLTAGGSDIWGTADNGFFVYTEHTGSFDVRVRVDSLVEGDEWAKAGIMVRESTDAGARNQMILITKNGTYPPYRDGGMNLYNHQWRDTASGSSASLADASRIRPTVFPSWLRMVRPTATSREILVYVSMDGEDWQLMNSHTFPEDFPETVLLGLAATAHDDDQTVTPLAEAIFSDLQIEVAGFDDTEAPTVLSARGNADGNTLTVVFSEAVDPASATTVANYSVTPGLTLSNPQLTAANTVVFNTSAQTEGADYTVTINNVKDASPQENTVAADTEVAFKAWLRSSGFLTADFFTGLTGTAILDLINSAKFLANTPDDTRFLPNFDTPNGYGDNYGLRVTGWFVPPVTGEYYFFIRSDDASQFFINPSGEAIPDPAANLPDAEETDCCDAFVELGVPNDDGATFPTTQIPYSLTAGQRYGVTFLVKEGTGGDWGQVAYRIEGDTTPAAELTPISGEMFETMVDATGAALTITTQPADIAVAQNRSASFNVAVNASSGAVGYQWLKDGEEIAGATAATYTIDSANVADDGAEYSVRVRVPGLTVTSETAVLSVSSDDVPPAVLSAGAFPGEATVGVAFDEPLDEASAETAANYQVSGATVSAATLHAGRFVELTLSGAVDAGFTVTVNDVEDVLGNVVSDATVNGQISSMSHEDLGTPGTDPVELGRAFTWGTGYFLAAGGNDIWDADDAGYIVYQDFTGPFDMRARVESLLNGDEWAKVGVMARESLDPGSRNEFAAITKPAPQINPADPLQPHIGGVNVYVRQWRDTTGGTSASKPAAERRSPTVFPSWLRLVRESTESNEMKSYISYDGEEWELYHTHTIPGDLLPETLVLGIASTSHDNAAGFPLAVSVVDQFSITTPGGGGGEDPNLTVVMGEGGGLTIEWETGTLVASPTVDGTYEPVAGANSPYNVTPSDAAMFYQVQVSP